MTSAITSSINNKCWNPVQTGTYNEMDKIAFNGIIPRQLVFLSKSEWWRRVEKFYKNYQIADSSFSLVKHMAQDCASKSLIIDLELHEGNKFASIL